VDRASNSKGAGIGIVLITPEGSMNPTNFASPTLTVNSCETKIKGSIWLGPKMVKVTCW